MKLDNLKILVAIVAITLLLFPLVTFTTGPLRGGLGFLFVIFFPGYTLLSAIFPRRDDIGGIERLSLSFGLSIAVVPFIGLILNYTPWGIKPYPILIFITLFIIAASAVGWSRQRKLSPEYRFSVTFGAGSSNWVGMTKLNRGLSVFLVIAILAALGSIGYAIAMPKQSESFTEFYIMGPEGKAEDYPKQVVLGEAGNVVIGVVNHEQRPTMYRVKITIDGIQDSELDAGTLAPEEKYDRRVSFIPQMCGEQQRVEFWLYKNGEARPYYEEPLYFYIDVFPPP